MLNKYRSIIWPLLSGLLLGAAFQYPAWFWLAWVALIPLFSCLCARDTLSKGQTLRALILFAATFYLWLVSFLFALYPLDFLGIGNSLSLVLIGLAWLLLAALETAGFVVLGLIFVKLRPIAAPSRTLLLLTSLWLLLEWAQGLSPVGFTWGRLAVSQAARPLLIQAAALGGSLLVSGLILAVNALLTLALLERRTKLWLGLAAAVFALNLAGGALRLAWPAAESAGQLKVGLIQGTLPSQLKWEEDTAQLNRERYYEQSLAAAEAGAQLILWPETSLAEVVAEEKLDPHNFYQLVAAEAHIPLLAGATWRQEEGGIYNALLYATEDDIRMVYGKRKLVPFGEYLPLGSLLAPLLPGLADFLTEGLRPWKGDGLLEAGSSSLGGLICFDSIFPHLARSSVAAGAEALLLVTNDSWFWDTPAMRQHYWQAQLRAVEQNRYVLRVANAGYSGIIDNYGRSLTEIAPEDSGFLLAEAQLLQKHTPYFYLREWVLLLALAGIVRNMCAKNVCVFPIYMV